MTSTATTSAPGPTATPRRWRRLVAVLTVLGLTAGLGAAGLAAAGPAAAAVPAAARSRAAAAAAAPAPVVTTSTFVFQGRRRSFTTITPARGGRGLPMVVFLSGSSITVAGEIRRDGLLTEVRAGLVSLLYPAPLSSEWNVGGGCCVRGTAPRADDQAFVRTVVRLAVGRLHPDKHRVFLLGYSAGAKLAWQLVCADAGPFAAVATYGGNPETPCRTRGTALPVLIGFGQRDAGEPIAGKPTNWRGTHPPAAVNVRTWLTRDGCRADRRARSVAGGRIDVTSWTTCARSSTAVSYDVWRGATHDLPRSPAVAPALSFGQVAWTFVHRFRRR